MNRREAIELIVNHSSEEDLIVSSNGFTSRELFSVKDRKNNFYMVGSMGLASSIALGYCLCNRGRRVVIIEGDANILMNLSSLVTIGARKPNNLFHFILDNGCNASTGGQETYSKSANLSEVAWAAGYERSELVTTKNQLLDCLTFREGPLFALVKISTEEFQNKRVSMDLALLAKRLMSNEKL